MTKFAGEGVALDELVKIVHLVVQEQEVLIERLRPTVSDGSGEGAQGRG